MRSSITVLACYLVLAVAFSSRITAREDGTGSDTQKMRAAEPVEVKEGEGERAAEDHGTRAGYFVSYSPRAPESSAMGSFYLEGDSGSCLYTLQVTDPRNPLYVMYKAELRYVGPDGSGSYWHYRIPLPGGLNWYFPKNAEQTPAVWYKIEAPGTKFVYYGPPRLFHINP